MTKKKHFYTLRGWNKTLDYTDFYLLSNDYDNWIKIWCNFSAKYCHEN